MKIRWREVYGESALIFFLPALLSWLAALVGYSFPLDKGDNLFWFTLFWVAIEAGVFIFHINRIKNVGDKLGDIILASVSAAMGVIFGMGFPGSVSVIQGMDEEEAESAYFAGIALMSLLFPFLIMVFLLLFGLAMAD